MSTPILDQEVRFCPGVGPKRARALEKKGVDTVWDLLHYYPRRHLDRSTVVPVRDLRETSDSVTVVGQVRAQDEVSGRSGRTRFEVIVEDERGGTMKAVWFRGIGWIRRVFEKGDRVAFHGSPQKYGRMFSMAHPDFDTLNGEGATLDTGRIVSLYPGGEALTRAGLSNRQLRRIIYDVFKDHGKEMPRYVPESIRAEHDLMEGRVALRAIHFPRDQAELRSAKRRLKFDELFLIQLLLARLRQRSRSDEDAPRLGPSGPQLERFLEEVLPFTLTGAQEEAIAAIGDDVGGPERMNRLLQGDVGSGKTVVAVAAMLMAIDHGYQAAFMAPTEILAEQHFRSLRTYLDSLGVSIRLLVGGMSKAERERSRREIATGEIDVAVGTHALIQSGVEFERLGLAVIDEQHRFGVGQRAEMFEKGTLPHTLLMTATPIPRSLALTLYGDLDVTTMKEKPAFQQEIDTEVFAPSERSEVYSRVRDRLQQGERGYVVYPLVEESEKMDLRDAETGHRRLKERFDDYEVGLLHGQLPAEEKDRVMRAFSEGEIDLLVATTVIEVGVDVPDATIMVIEHADRFGLSQLHQLRGRVGRGEKKSSCLLIAPRERTDDAEERLEAMARTGDGFEISREDLRIRGAGEFFGTRQSGIPDLRIADLTRDEEILEDAREAAFALIETDPRLEQERHRALRRELIRFAPEEVELARIG